jgi:prephenate dehydratase
MKIGIQGELGAYSHIAANNLYKDAEIKTCATFEATFKEAHQDENIKIIIPIENSLAGRVADIHYLLPKYKLQIHREYFLNVEHNLLCKPGATIKDIKYVRSHAQAIGQCQNIINKKKI